MTPRLMDFKTLIGIRMEEIKGMNNAKKKKFLNGSSALELIKWEPTTQRKQGRNFKPMAWW